MKNKLIEIRQAENGVVVFNNSVIQRGMEIEPSHVFNKESDLFNYLSEEFTDSFVDEEPMVDAGEAMNKVGVPLAGDTIKRPPSFKLVANMNTLKSSSKVGDGGAKTYSLIVATSEPIRVIKFIFKVCGEISTTEILSLVDKWRFEISNSIDLGANVFSAGEITV